MYESVSIFFKALAVLRLPAWQHPKYGAAGRSCLMRQNGDFLLSSKISLIVHALIFLALLGNARSDGSEVVDPGKLNSSRYGFTVFVDGNDVSAGWFQLLETDHIWVTFDYPAGTSRLGAYIVHDGLLCFSGFKGLPFPDECGDLSLHQAQFTDGMRLWFASAEPGAFYPGDDMELLRQRAKEAGK